MERGLGAGGGGGTPLDRRCMYARQPGSDIAGCKCSCERNDRQKKTPHHEWCTSPPVRTNQKEVTGGQAGEEGAAREVVNAADKEMDELITLGRPRSYKPHYQTGRFSSK